MTGALEVFLRKQEQKQALQTKFEEVLKIFRDCYDGDAKVLEPAWWDILDTSLNKIL